MDGRLVDAAASALMKHGLAKRFALGTLYVAVAGSLPGWHRDCDYNQPHVGCCCYGAAHCRDGAGS